MTPEHTITPTLKELTEEVKDLRERMSNAVLDLQAIQNDKLTMQQVWGHAMSAEYHLTLGLKPGDL